MRAPVPSLETTRRPDRQRLEPLDKAVHGLIHGDRGRIAAHIGLHPSGVVYPDGDPFGLQIGRDIAALPPKFNTAAFEAR